ncbi:leucine rich adaptor protein 1-like [Saccostrea echinata]|uniref:leucine rich adaptor protein 1-like n=1 Tax=Saccostrea echinata TaxID=191078 RepID=UPI002A834B7D|nr:leucine rich adaptor protein 1-like [Saccostrea echinata]
MESSTDRISSKLEVLKADLKAMRLQDVKLMKQLIGINESIQSLAKSRQRTSSRGPQVMSTADFNATATPLVRQQSAPSYNKLHRNNSTGSIESIEEIGSSVEDINEETIEELEDYLNCSMTSLPPPIPTIPKSHSLAVMTPLPDEEDEADDSKYEGILMTNIKLWKYSQQKCQQKT